jgi:hypothetical protein
MRKHAFLYQRHACGINVLTAPAKRRTSAAKVVQRLSIEDIKMRRGRSGIEFRRYDLPLVHVPSTD